MRHSRWWCTGIATAAALVPGVAFAHGSGRGEPSLSTLLTGWEFDPFFFLPVGLGAWGYFSAVRQVNRAHPNSKVPVSRVIYFSLGLLALVIAIASPIGAYDTTLFSAHMWQHMLLMMVAAPLLLLGAPITLVLRVASPRVRKEVLLPVLRSLPVRVLAFPVVAWLIFAGTMWTSHFLPIFNAALENVWLHRLEHVWYMSAALLFWWPVVGADPSPWRMPHPVRLLYVFLQMPQNSFLALAIYNAGDPLYRHYETLARDWGPSALSDQQLAGITMWVFGDLLFLAALGFVAYGWVKHEELAAIRTDRALAREALAKQRANAGSG
ncbi:MAG: cytochrome c oxidase assembly protein [Dehalococcoidia bacterium]|nr:cytochrome c oxidase assembly protein [Dehalococcoidia bacterium]